MSWWLDLLNPCTEREITASYSTRVQTEPSGVNNYGVGVFSCCDCGVVTHSLMKQAGGESGALISALQRTENT